MVLQAVANQWVTVALVRDTGPTAFTVNIGIENNQKTEILNEYGNKLIVQVSKILLNF
jgi:hypothetical protein